MRDVVVKKNIIDRAYEYFAPQIARDRYRARMTLASADAYHGASKSRRGLSEWSVARGDSDTVTEFELQELRDRSSDLLRNDPLACGIINTKVTKIIGGGLKLQSRIDAAYLGISDDQAEEIETGFEREFSLWANSIDCDAERTSNFYDFQGLAERSRLEKGDCLVVMPHYRHAYQQIPYNTKFQIIEAERISNPNWQSNTDTFVDGVEKDINGAPIRYHFTLSHPGKTRSSKSMSWASVDAFDKKTGRRNAIHLLHKKRPGQTRGIPDLAPVIEPLKMLSRYTEAELMAAVISGMFTVFIKTENAAGFQPMEPSADIGGKASDKDFKMSSGAILNLGLNESIETANPGRPNDSFDPFVLAILRQIGVAVEIPFEILIKHFTSSYSAARAAMLEAWQYFIVRREAHAKNLCEPFYELVATEAVAMGRVVAPGFLAGDRSVKMAYLGSEWIGPPRGQINELAENEADVIAEDRGWKTVSQNTAERGGNWEAKHRQRVKEVNLRRAQGLEIESQPKKELKK